MSRAYNIETKSKLEVNGIFHLILETNRRPDSSTLSRFLTALKQLSSL